MDGGSCPFLHSVETYLVVSSAKGARMIKDFAELKMQLEELSSVINSFKSEAVQLRIVELILRAESGEDQDEREVPVSSTTLGRRRKGRRSPASAKKVASGPTAGRAEGKATRGSRTGPATILSELVAEGFFHKKRTIGDVIDHSSSQKARIFKPNELSGPLGRFVRDKRLKREKNANGQYEYQNR